jgi:hypothetical protein
MKSALTSSTRLEVFFEYVFVKMRVEAEEARTFAKNLYKIATKNNPAQRRTDQSAASDNESGAATVGDAE